MDAYSNIYDKFYAWLNAEAITNPRLMEAEARAKAWEIAYNEPGLESINVVQMQSLIGNAVTNVSLNLSFTQDRATIERYLEMAKEKEKEAATAEWEAGMVKSGQRHNVEPIRAFWKRRVEYLEGKLSSIFLPSTGEIGVRTSA